jgi:hypothetical protein
MKMSWVTLDRICAEEMLSDEEIRLWVPVTVSHSLICGFAGTGA